MAWAGDYLFTKENVIIIYLSIALDIALGESSLKITLKVVSATLFLGLNENTYQIKKNVCYFTSKLLFILEKNKF